MKTKAACWRNLPELGNEGETKMTVRMNTFLLSGSLALSFIVTARAMAGESNKKTEFEFSAPVEIPGHVLTPGKYLFELLDDDANRNVVQIFSEDADGNEALIATVLSVPDFMANTPDKPVIHFEERPTGTPEAIHSWFYPGENTGWEFVYPKGRALEAKATATPDTAPVTAAAIPSVIPTRVQPAPQKEPASEVRVIEARIFVAQNERLAQPSIQGTEIQTGAAQVLPETAENSGLEIMIGFAMSGGGLVAVFAAS
jgi:hypothetical protein